MSIIFIILDVSSSPFLSEEDEEVAFNFGSKSLWLSLSRFGRVVVRNVRFKIKAFGNVWRVAFSSAGVDLRITEESMVMRVKRSREYASSMPRMQKHTGGQC